MFIAAYVGARPAGRPLPPLADAPSCPTVPLHLIHSFARDMAHDGRFAFYDPEQLDRACSQQCGSQRGMLSLAGAGFAWGPSVDLNTWVHNAVRSLQGMLQRYNLCGLDINYEEGLEREGFPEAMAGLIAHLKAWSPGLLITIAPYYLVWGPYKQLLQLAGGSIDYVLWQAYAELESPSATADQLVAVYNRMAGELGGYQRLVLGVNTEPKRRLGAQLPAVAEAFRRLKAKGIGGAFVWALDNSCACGYKTEAALLAIAAEAPGLQGGAASHEHSSQHCCCVIA